ncbi:MAG: tetratricopeptide repeat protein [Alphaproteobacteria bacterium]
MLIICVAVLGYSLGFGHPAFAKMDFDVIAYLDRDKLAAGSRVALVRARAERGNLDAQHELGALLATGRGADRNHAEAAQWLIRAAVRGHDSAQYWLGNLYMRGAGLPRDFNRMAMWWRKAASQGNVSARYALAVAYRDGRTLNRNPALSHAWFAMAANKTVAAGLHRGGAVAKKRMKIRRLTAAQVAREEAKARRFARDFKGNGQGGR